MTFKKICSLVLLCLISINLFGCTQETEQLQAPNIIIFENMLTWNQIENADSYDIYVDGNFYTNVKDTMYTFETIDKADSIYVIAKSNDSKYLNSNQSNVVSLNYADLTNSTLYTYEVLEAGSWEFEGLIDEAITFVEQYQLKREFWWRSLERIFDVHPDSNGGYSAEFWGKLVRGGVLTYNYTQDEELYLQLETTIRNVIELQKKDVDGRLSGYDVENEFTGWDLRSRSYNLLGFEYFYTICKDEELKEEIIESLCQQLDYIMKFIGDQPGQTGILQTSPDWGGATSANMLEGVVGLYSLTKEEKYKDYAKYIINTGGSTMLDKEGRTLVQCALAGIPMYQYGCRKVYEVGNFMEGVLQYYFATGDTFALNVAKGFYQSCDESEVIETGCLAIDVEEACNSAVEQSNPDNVGRMQETCVGTVWLKFCLHLYQITGEASFMDNIEKIYYNYFMGVIDWELHNNWPIFSYSPIATTARADVYSGTAYLGENNEYCQSCCVISGVSGLPTVVESAVLRAQDGFAVNLYIPGAINTTTSKGTPIQFICQTGYPVDGNIAMTVNVAKTEKMKIKFRIPSWSEEWTLKINGEKVDAIKDGYVELDREWKYGDKVELEFDMRTYLIKADEGCSNPKSQYNVVVKRGPLVFSRDYRLEGENIFQPLKFKEDKDGYLNVKVVENTEIDRSQCELMVELENGEFVTLVDYGSAGKTMSDESTMCLWIPTEDYWSVDLSKDMVVVSYPNKAPNVIDEVGHHMVSNEMYINNTSKDILEQLAWRLEEQEDGTYKIKILSTGGYLTVRNDSRIISSTSDLGFQQKFTIKQCGFNRYMLILADGRVLSKYDDDGIIYVTDNIGHPNQYWSFNVITE